MTTPTPEIRDQCAQLIRQGVEYAEIVCRFGVRLKWLYELRSALGLPKRYRCGRHPYATPPCHLSADAKARKAKREADAKARMLACRNIHEAAMIRANMEPEFEPRPATDVLLSSPGSPGRVMEYAARVERGEDLWGEAAN